MTLLLGVVVLLVRYRRFGQAERRQIAWPLYGLALTGCAIVVLGGESATVHGLPGWLQYALYLPVLLLIPAGLIIGVVRYQLLDIQLVVRRSVVYGVLWLLIAAAYAGLAVAFGVAAGRRVPLDLAIVLTIVVTIGGGTAPAAPGAAGRPAGVRPPAVRLRADQPARDQAGVLARTGGRGHHGRGRRPARPGRALGPGQPGPP